MTSGVMPLSRWFWVMLLDSIDTGESRCVNTTFVTLVELVVGEHTEGTSKNGDPWIAGSTACSAIVCWCNQSRHLTISHHVVRLAASV